MKQRIISAAVAIIICIFPLLFGGILLNILLGFCLCVATYEFAKLPNKKFDLFVFLAMILFSIAVMFFYEKALALIMIYVVIIFAYSLFNEEFGLDDVCATIAMSERMV